MNFNKSIYIDLKAGDVLNLLRAVDEHIFSLSQDRFSYEQAGEYRKADDVTHKLKELRLLRKRLNFLNGACTRLMLKEFKNRTNYKLIKANGNNQDMQNHG